MLTDRNNPSLWSLSGPQGRRSRARTLLIVMLLIVGLLVVFCGEVAAAESVTLEASYSVRDMVYVFFTALGSVAVLLFGSMRWLAVRLVSLYDANNKARFDELQGALKSIQDAQAKNADRINDVDRDLLKLRAELSEKFVRRDDYVRTETAFHARLDRLNQIIQDYTTKLGNYAARS